ncbi:MAG: SapC family protein, partial [Alphaproteobacteria bacterium]|nr:SapC family protein [Alphaproteobacteria bacterium]
MNAKTAAAANNPQMPVFYQGPTPLDSRAHGKLGLKRNFGFSFAADVNAVPINVIEIPQIAGSYPIAFSPDTSATPVAILGLRDNENLFVDAQGVWEPHTYIPAYVRRYPFIFSETPANEEQLILCVDMNPDIVGEDGEQKFFEADGKPSQLSNQAIEFCKSYHAAALQTMAFGKFLHESGLLQERTVQITAAGNRRINFSGFRAVDEKKLAELSDAEFLKLRKEGYLPFLYAHLFSVTQWQRLTALLNKRLESEGIS